MAKAYITEYVGPGVAHGGVIPVANAGSWRENASSPLAITSGTTSSVAFGTNTQLVRVNVDATCSINIGVTVTATANNARMSQGQTEYFTVVPGQVLAVIVNT
jgi:hypothetical protein